MPLHAAQMPSQPTIRSPPSAQRNAQPWSPSNPAASPTAEHSRPHQSAKRKHAETDSPTQPGANKAPRLTQESTSHDPQSSPPQPTRDPARVLSMTTVVCLHAAVAQKSYGSEKRFLCPPPLVRIEGHPAQLRHQQLIMSIISETGERTQEQRAAFDDHLSCSFKYLHVGNTSKAKSFQLELDIADPFSSPSSQLHSTVPPRTWAQFDSAPVSIISKPSKKTAKTRNVSSCILAGGPVSLFNRVNAQTVRTKYMMIEGGSLCASNASWSAFTVNVIRRPAHETPHIGGPEPVIYGCEIVLTDQATGISTGPLLVRKVDKGRIVPDDGGPVSQMQKIALQRANPDGTRSYLSAAGPHPGAVAQGFVSASPTSAQGSQHGISVQLPSASTTGGIHPLLFQAPRIREEADSEGTRVQVDEVDDYICWTIVGISKFQYTFFDAYGRNTTPPEPITPFPTLFTAPVYRPTTNTMELTISNFFYDDPKTNQPAPLEVWLGDIGPLRYRIYQAVPTGPLQPFQIPRSGLEDSPPPPGQQALGEMPGAPISPVSDRSSAGALPAIPPRHYNAGPAHTIVIVEMPTVGEIISSIGETVPPQGDDAESASPESGMTPRHDPATLGPLLARGLPIFFIRPYDGTGYHAGRSVACENIFQTLNIGGDGAVNQAWIAAAQAAQHDGTAHGWTLRVV
ncbi:hypothetical protein EXIGLDRAFT_647152 [Exidia glandulosa HHB12029]|uniref:Beta-trefoil n=1 Tax=Exidia glandulosa HHB12029 TaxID=1314781 RepID=A0A165HUJ2_EXIGL|nr:hypothetical protein EXIGLDRAFT_647152 [Exidia glandulosa HHB12029]